MEGVLPADNVLLAPVNVVVFDAWGRLLHVDWGRDAGAWAKFENHFFTLHSATYGG